MNARCWLLVSMLMVFLTWTAAGQDKDKKTEPKKQANVFTDPDTAPIDYILQGEYAAEKSPVAAQVVARGNGKFDIYFLRGGLPGAGFDASVKKLKIEAKLDDSGKVVPFKADFEGAIMPGKETLLHVRTNFRDQSSYTLKRVERKSTTLGANPPEGATILFDGKNSDEWKPGKMSGDLLAVPNNTKKSFTNFKLHIEFRTPFQPTAGGQGRGNSGVYVCGREVQVLDSFGLTPGKGDCGALYSDRVPDVNMCYPPLVWQTYDIEHRAGKIDPETKKQGSPSITVLHNGIKIHENIELKGAASKGGINLQDHGNPVVYRNIWVVETK